MCPFSDFLTREWRAERGFLPWYGTEPKIISEKDWFRPQCTSGVIPGLLQNVARPLQHCDLLEKGKIRSVLLSEPTVKCSPNFLESYSPGNLAGVEFPSILIPGKPGNLVR